jgi:hypothetical protein
VWSGKAPIQHFSEIPFPNFSAPGMSAGREGYAMTGRGRFYLAVIISLAIHASVGVAWFGLREDDGGSSIGIKTEVDAPDDREMVITLRELRVARPKTIEPPAAPAAPDPLPPSITHPVMAPSTIHEVGHSGHSPAPAPPLAKSGESKPLHGKLKAGKSIVYVLDRSSSMGPDGRLAKACAAIKASLGQLSDECRFQIVGYNGGAEAFMNQLVLATATNRARAERWLDGLLAEGTSKHLVGIREALWLHPDAIFLLTDADDLDEKEAKAIRGLLKTPVYLSVVLFGSGQTTGNSPLIRLATEMGGKVQRADQ